MKYMIMNHLNMSLTRDKCYWADPTSVFHHPAKLSKKGAMKLVVRLEDEDRSLDLRVVEVS